MSSANTVRTDKDLDISATGAKTGDEKAGKGESDKRKKESTKVTMTGYGEHLVIKTVEDEYILCVDDVTVKIKASKILQDITFTATTGSLLAILGPTGSGKTMLLNTISGCQPCSSGHVTLNQLRFNKQLRRRLGFVQQEDVFFPNLTLWETLYFTTMIRISENVPHQVKLATLNGLIDELGLKGCLHTVMGDMFARGLSGGEKKRASIACELLTDPNILLLDEPTSGLDSSTALSLMRKIKELSANKNKMVILSIHQPSSQIYRLFDSLLLLANGQVVYFGVALTGPLDFFREFGHDCEPNYNPADFCMEILRSEKELLDRMVYAQRNRMVTTMDRSQKSSNTLIDGQNDVLSPETSILPGIGSLDTVINFDGRPSSSQTNTAMKRWSKSRMTATKRWNTSFRTQFKMLTWRSFKQSRGSLLHLYNIIFYTIIGIIIGISFFQMQHSKDNIRDRMGLLFIVLAFWAFEASGKAMLAIPDERGVVSRERLAGTYRLSAYYLAKTVSELPLQIIMPTCFYIFIYWMAGLGGVSEFFLTWLLFLLSTATAQGLGLFLAYAIMDIQMAFINNSVVLMIGMLFCGFITQSIPEWLTWAKYLSVINHPMSSMSIILFGGMENISCNATSVSIFPQCLRNETDYIVPMDILEKAGIDIPIYCYISTLILIFIAFRIFAYIALRVRYIVTS